MMVNAEAQAQIEVGHIFSYIKLHDKVIYATISAAVVLLL